MRMLLPSWNLVVQRERREEMTALAEEARKHLGKQSVSIWTSSKERLVQMAIEELGMSRAEASRERVGQLQFLLKTRRAETNLGEAIDARASLPRGLSKMKKADLQEEMLARGLDIHQMNGQDKVREAMIRDITLHVEMVSDRAMSVDETARPPSTAVFSRSPTTATASSVLPAPPVGSGSQSVEHWNLADSDVQDVRPRPNPFLTRLATKLDH